MHLAPGLLPLVPRAAIAIVVLVAFSEPSADLQSPYGATDKSNLRDIHFFQTDGALTAYAHGVLLAFTACVLFRLVIVLVSAAVLWSFSARPLGGIFASKSRTSSPMTPRTPKKPRTSMAPHDPSTTMSPRKDWVASENEFDWAWRERARSRVQDAFELCMIRRGTASGSWIALGIPLPPSPAPPRGGEVTATTPTAAPNGGGAPLRQPGSGSSFTPQDTTPAEASPKPMTADDFVRSLIAIAPPQSPKKSSSSTNFSTLPAPARPESTIDPLGTKRVSGPHFLATPPPPPPPGFNSSGRPSLGTYSIAINSSTSSHDLFYTLAETPAVGRSRSSGLGGVPTGPPTSYRFQRDDRDNEVEEEASPTRRFDAGRKRDSAASDESVTDDSAALLPSPAGSPVESERERERRDRSRSRSNSLVSITSRLRDRAASVSSRVTVTPSNQTHGSAAGSGSRSGSRSGSGIGSGSGSKPNSRSSSLRRRSSTNISPTTHGFSRARSTSVSLLRETVVHAASAVAAATGSPVAGVAGVVRRARSGTVLSKESEYSRVTGENDDENEEEYEVEVGAKEQLKMGMGMGTGAALSRDQTDRGLGPGQG